MIDYLALFPIILLQLASAALIALRLLRPTFTYSWLIAAFSSLMAWVLVLFSRGNFPQSISLFRWEPEWLFTSSPVLLVDQYSWAYAFSISTLLLSAILTDAARQADASWFIWTTNLLVCSLGIAAVQSGNPLTLLLLWTAIDLVEGTIYFYRGREEAQSTRVVLSFSSRTAGTLLLIWAMLYTTNAGKALDYSQFPQQAGILLLAAAFLRLGVIPLQHTHLSESISRRNLDTVSRLTTAAASLILITRAASVEFIGSSTPYLIAFVGLVAVYVAVMWAVSRNEFDGLPYWIIGFAAISIASAVRSQPEASLAWGLLAILTGALLFLVSTRNRYLIIILLIGFISISTLPYTPVWNGVLLYSPDFSPLMIFFLISQSIFMAGYIRFALLPTSFQPALERWVWVIYPWGLVIIPLSQYIIGWQVWNIELRLSTILPGMLVSLLTGVLLALAYWLRSRSRISQYATRILYGFNNLLSMGWIYLMTRRLYLVIGRSVSFVVAVFEGEGGVLWALFFLVLFIAILTQIRLGV